MLKKFSKDIVVYGFITGLNKSLNFIFVPIFSRYFTEEEYGIIDLVTTVILLLTLLGTFQLEAAIGRYFYDEEDDFQQRRNLSTGLWSIFFAGILFALVIYIIHQPLALYLFEHEGYESLLLVTLCIIPCVTLYTYYIALFRYLNQPNLFGLFTLAQVILTFGFTLFFLFVLDWKLNGVFLALLVSYGVVALVMSIYFLYRKVLGFMWHWPSLKRYLRFSLPLLPSALLGWANSYANRFLMLQFLTLADIGLYTVAIKIASVIKLLEEGVKMTWSPFLYQNLSNPNHREIYKSIFTFLSYLSFFTVGMITLFVPEILTVIVPSNYHIINDVLILILLSYGVSVLIQIILIGPAITQKTIYTSFIGFISTSANLILLYYLIQDFGLISVPISLLFGILVQLFLAWVISEKLYSVGFSKMDLLIPFFVCCMISFLMLAGNTSLGIRILVATILTLLTGLKFKKQLYKLFQSISIFT